MKQKDLEKKIARIYEDDIPDVLSKIDLKSIQIKEQPSLPPKVNFFTRFVSAFRSMRYAGAFASIVLLVVLMIVFNPGQTGPTDPTDPTDPTNPTDPVDKPIAFDQKEEVYTLSAVSAVNLMMQTTPEANDLSFYPLKFMTSPVLGPLNSTTIQILDYMDWLHKNLNMIEPIIGNKEQMQFSVAASTKPGYTYELTFQSIDFLNEVVEYTIYYNETQKSIGVYEMNGIMESGDTTYILEGEVEENEDEFTLELFAYHPNKEDTYVKVFQEIKADEQYFEYEAVYLDETILESSFKIQFSDDGDIEIELAYETDTLEIQFQIKRSKHAIYDTYEIEYEIEGEDQEEEGEIQVEIMFNSETLKYEYVYHIRVEDLTQEIIKIRK